MSLALSELEAAETLVENNLFREALVHMYFACFYASQAILVPHVAAIPSHKNVEAQLHKHFGKSKVFPRRYVALHVLLHKMRNEYNYQVTHSPNPGLLRKKLSILRAYLKFCFRCAPTLETIELLRSILEDNGDKIKDFSYDIYCPKTYSHHVRLTMWQPPFYLDIFSHEQLQAHARRMLASLRVRRPNDYVVGLNSKLDQYSGTHLVMLDIDSLDASVESVLSEVGGILLKSGRGFHFIGNAVIEGQKAWETLMRQLKRKKTLKPHLDRDHIEVSLKRGYATLRITTSAVKPQAPVFYKEL